MFDNLFTEVFATTEQYLNHERILATHGITKTILTRIKNGSTIPTIDFIKRLATACNMPPITIVERFKWGYFLSQHDMDTLKNNS